MSRAATPTLRPVEGASTPRRPRKVAASNLNFVSLRRLDSIGLSRLEEPNPVFESDRAKRSRQLLELQMAKNKGISHQAQHGAKLTDPTYLALDRFKKKRMLRMNERVQDRAAAAAEAADEDEDEDAEDDDVRTP